MKVEQPLHLPVILPQSPASRQCLNSEVRIKSKKSGYQPDFFLMVGFGRLIKPGTSLNIKKVIKQNQKLSGEVIGFAGKQALY